MAIETLDARVCLFLEMAKAIPIITLTRDELLTFSSNSIIFRHGETPINCKKRIQGSIDTDETRLTADAVQLTINQAIEILPHLQNKPLIITSHMKRAVETGELIKNVLKKRNLSVSKTLILEKAGEFNFGEWEGLLIEELVSGMHGQEHEHVWVPNPFNASLVGLPPHGENMFAFAYRVQKIIRSVNKLSMENNSQSIVITHAMIGRMIRYLSMLISEQDGGGLTANILYNNGARFFKDNGKFVKIPNGKLHNAHNLQLPIE